MSQPTLETLLRMPWTIRGPSLTSDLYDEVKWWEIRVEELPDFFVADATRDEVMAEYMPALTAFLESYTEAERASIVSPAVLWTWLAAFTQPAKTGSTWRGGPLDGGVSR